MIVRNTTNNDIEVQIHGHMYYLPANGFINDVPEEDARYWKERLHSFLDISPDKEKVKPVITPVEPKPVVDKIKKPKNK